MKEKSKDQIIIDLQNEIRKLNEEVFILNGVIDALNKLDDKALIAKLRARLKENFEVSNEHQPWLFNEFEATAEEGFLQETPDDIAPDEQVVSSYVRKKARHGVTIPKDTPVIDIYDDASVETCPRCGSEMKESGEKVYESFTKISRTVIIRKHVKQYVCPNCEPNEQEGRVVMTPVTNSMLDGTVCDPTMFAQIVENKFSFSLPLYRQAIMFKEIGLSRFTMCSWITKIGEQLEKNMAPCLEKMVYSYPLVNMDETTLKIVGLKDANGDKKAPRSKSNAFMIVRAATDSGGKYGPVIFTYTDNRRNETLSSLIKPYHGVVQTDGLNGYSFAAKNENFVHAGCMVHARRKCIKANGNQKEGTAFELLKMYQTFFHQEGLLQDEYRDGNLTPEEYVIKRRQILEPILNRMKNFCEKNVGSAIGDLKVALQYPLDRWDSLVKFLDYSFVTSSNQRAENAIRPFCVGKKNWLFVLSEFGAKISAFFYSLVESCKCMGINFQDYMTYVLLNANKIKDGDEAAWTKMLPGNCDISSAVAYRERIFSAKPDSSRTEPYCLRGKRV